MTAYTPIYNLPYVEASDLVANYPTVSEELAENVETALGNIPNVVKAWVKFNGTGTVAVQGGLNVSSVTDVNVGQYTVNFTTAIADVNYAALVTLGDSSGICFARISTQATGSCTIQFVNYNASAYVDAPNVYALFVR